VKKLGELGTNFPKTTIDFLHEEHPQQWALDQKATDQENYSGQLPLEVGGGCIVQVCNVATILTLPIIGIL
jgi:hypothetical protein